IRTIQNCASENNLRDTNLVGSMMQLIYALHQPIAIHRSRKARQHTGVVQSEKFQSVYLGFKDIQLILRLTVPILVVANQAAVGIKGCGYGTVIPVLLAAFVKKIIDFTCVKQQNVLKFHLSSIGNSLHLLYKVRKGALN